MMRAFESELRSGLATLGLSLSDVQVGQLLDYMALIQKWTKVYNLTAVRDAGEMLTHHLLDSLAALPPLRRQLANVPQSAHAEAQKIKLLDVGAGAGLPGVVIAICCPDIDVDCVDTVAKKAAFIQQVAVTLKLVNLRGIHARVETLTTPYSVVTSRAFASLSDFVTWSAAALAQQGVWMAMKGKEPVDEMAALGSFATVFHVEQLQVPALAAERCIVWLRKSVNDGEAG